MISPKDVLEKYWRFSQFRGLQEEVIRATLKGEDTCVFFPTGAGKSICFQVSTLLLDGLCIVISPLISLMQDQVQNLESKGIKAMHLKGGISLKETDRLFDNLKFRNYKFLYLSPEKLKNPLIIERLSYLDVSLIAIDEAHCISQWGHDFRPAYLEISKLRSVFRDKPIMALTATATVPVQKDIISQLHLDSPIIFKSSFRRSNISISVLKTDNKWETLVNLSRQSKSSSIVYVRNRKTTVDLAQLLNENGISTASFHGGLVNETKKEILEKWLNNEVKVVAATTAFGMGIDKADVDFIGHIHLPESLESYYQEIGRAGRNGKPAKAVLIYNETDVKRLKYQFLRNLPDVQVLKKVYKHLMNYLRIAYGEGFEEQFGIDLHAFCKKYKLDIAYTFELLKTLDRLGVMRLNQNYEINAKIKILVTHSELLDYLRHNTIHKDLITTMLRTYSGLFDFDVSVDLEYISRKLKSSLKNSLEKLKILESLKILNVNLIQQDLTIQMLQSREDERTINMHRKTIEIYRQQKIKQVDNVIQYVQNDKLCKQRQLLSYFGESESKDCGICSVCLSQGNNSVEEHPEDLESAILNSLEESPKSSNQLILSTQYSKQNILNQLELLLEEKKLKLTANNLYEINR